ncbi:nitroreductase [Bradyrhizobium genosp. P]|uniref:nitroreductase n=1 Tax=Bradyrhizobium genosp. P TaxID=83641 RepID=UPI003CE7E5F1
MSDRVPSGDVDRAIASRRSVRAFLSKNVPREDIERILEVASRSPSGANAQPWKVHVLTGKALRRLSELLLDEYNAPGGPTTEPRPYQYYPEEWVEPYLGRRRKVGLDMYRLLGIAKGEKSRMHEQTGRNFEFFGAPVGLIFAIDRRMAVGSWLDYGLFLQSIMIAARGRGLDTCPQAAFIDYADTIAEFVGLPQTEIVVCGMSFGYADPEAVVNRLETDRAPVSTFTVFHE